MKYLIYRDNFLDNKKNYDQEYQSSALVKEYLENDIRFGDSLFGRLVNSSWQILRIGAKMLTIPFLLNKFEKHLQVMVDRLKFDQISKEYPTLHLKCSLEEIRSCCKSSLSDDEKLLALIGYDGTPMYNPRSPIGDIPGYYVARRIIVPSLVQSAYDKITEPTMRGRLEKAITEAGVKNLLDYLSEFMDKLREMTTSSSSTSTSTTAAPFTTTVSSTPFGTNLLNILNNLASLQLNESTRFLKYSDFLKINEDSRGRISQRRESSNKFRTRFDQMAKRGDEGTQSETDSEEVLQQPSTEKYQNLEQLKKLSNELISEIQNKSDDEIKNSETFKKFTEILGNLSADEVEKLKSNQTESGENLMDALKSITNVDPSEKMTAPKELTQPEKTKTEPEKLVGEKPRYRIKADIGKSKEATEPEKKEPEKGDSVTSTTVPKFTTTTTTTGQVSPSQTNVGATKPETSPTTPPQKEIPSRFEDTKEDDEEDEVNPEQLTAEKSKYSSYIQMILEATGVGPAPTITSTTPGGSSTTTSGSTTTTTPSATPTTVTGVSELWDVFFSEIEKTFPAKMTQDDINKLNNYSPEDIEIAEEFLKKPDPLLQIVKIFGQANRLYTTDHIPSGREGGRVSSMTFRRFKYVGGSTPGAPQTPGYGPWVYVSVYNQWKNGVYKIMTKPEYVDVFKDFKKMIPESALDRYINSEKIFEAVTSMKSLQDFIMDMLSLKNQGDFETAEANALKKFFDLSILPSEIKPKIDVPTEDIKVEKGDVKANSFIWEQFKGTQFNEVDRFNFFAFPIEDLREDKGGKVRSVLFIQPISISGNKVEVKFVYDNQGTINKFLDSVSSGSKKTDWSCDGQTRPDNVYYGIMKRDFSNGFRITYANVNNTSASGVKADPLYPKDKAPNQPIFRARPKSVRLNVGGSMVLFSAKLVHYDKTKTKKGVASTNSNCTLNTARPERNSDVLKNVETSTSDKLYVALEKLGSKIGFW